MYVKYTHIYTSIHLYMYTLYTLYTLYTYIHTHTHIMLHGLTMFITRTTHYLTGTGIKHTM